MFLLPSDQPATVMTGAAIADTTPARPSYLVAAPELIAELDAALETGPVLVGETMAREAMLPDPSASAMTVAAVAAVETEVAPDVDPIPTVHVGGTAVNLRAGPSKSTARLTTLQPGQPLVPGETANGWVQVTTVDGTSGWVYSSYVTGETPDSVQQPQTPVQTVAAREPEPVAQETQRFARHARIANDTMLRARPSRNARNLFVLPAGERVGIAEIDGRWARVVLRSGASGWVMIR